MRLLGQKSSISAFGYVLRLFTDRYFVSSSGLSSCRTNVDNLIIGAVMPLVPGVAITNSFRDILAGHLISGTARGTEAIFHSCRDRCWHRHGLHLIWRDLMTILFTFPLAFKHRDLWYLDQYS